MLKRYFRQQDSQHEQGPAAAAVAAAAAAGLVEEYDFCEEIEAAAVSQGKLASTSQDVVMSDATVAQIDSRRDDEVPAVEAGADSQLQVSPVEEIREEAGPNDSHQRGEPVGPGVVSEGRHEATISREELLAAKQELQKTLVKHSNPESSAAPTNRGAPTQEELETASRTLQETFATNNQLVAAQATSSGAQLPNSSTVSYCIDLFQRNPDVQAAVISLARDPAVWDAFLQNERVQELMSQTRRRKRFRFEEGHNECNEGTSYGLGERSSSNPFWVALRWVLSTVWGMVDLLAELVHGVFGFIDAKLFGESGSDATDNSVKACMVLAVLLLALILVAR